jgi:hypothetical protein
MKRAIILSHKYSESGLSLIGLKNEDRAQLDALRCANDALPKGEKLGGGTLEKGKYLIPLIQEKNLKSSLAFWN